MPKSSHLSPIYADTKRNFVWSDIHEQAFQHMKQLVAQDTTITYPQFDKPFLIHTDPSDKQIGGVVMQDNCPLGFFSKKLTDTQQRYPVTKHELWAIAEILKYFKHMLLGHEIVMQTDNKNLTYPTLTHTNRVLWQRLLLEEYGVKLEYIKGEKNIVADALSR
jgi:hypothetical protein